MSYLSRKVIFPGAPLFGYDNIAFIGYVGFSMYVHTVNLSAAGYCDQLKRQLEMAIE
jgi:hypothetical protein